MNVWVCPANTSAVDGARPHKTSKLSTAFHVNLHLSKQQGLCVNLVHLQGNVAPNNTVLMTVSVPPCLILPIFAASPDLLHLWGPREGEQGCLRSLHDLQQTGLQASFPRHLVSVQLRLFVVAWKCVVYCSQLASKVNQDVDCYERAVKI